MKTKNLLLLFISLCFLNIGCQSNKAFAQRNPSSIIPAIPFPDHKNYNTGEIRITPGKGIELKLPDKWIIIGPYLNSHMTSSQYLMNLIADLFSLEKLQAEEKKIILE